jgi:hypothetical protein
MQIMPSLTRGNLPGDVMTADSGINGHPGVLDVVAILSDLPADKLARGQVGTVVESLDQDTALVEFSDDQGHAYAVVPVPRSQLLVLHYVPQAA